MKKFEELPIKNLNEKKIILSIDSYIKEFKEASNEETAYKIFNKYNKFINNLGSDMNVIMVNFSIDTTNVKNIKANQNMTKVIPLIEERNQLFVKELLNCKYREYIENKTGSYLFKMYENSLKTFDEKIISKLIKEKELSDRYNALLASAKIEYDGKIQNLNSLAKYRQDINREVRKESSELFYGFMTSIEDELANIYDQLVHLRDEMAKDLGFKNYIELAYLKLGRYDYNYLDVRPYRELIAKIFTPLARKINQQRIKRLNIEKMMYYDETISYIDGNPMPKGNVDYLINEASKMYHDMGKEVGRFFDMMVDYHLLDLVTKPGKISGGFMCYFYQYKVPFIFANFNGTSSDVDVLTHEFGHAFQSYCSKNIKIPEYQSPTLEACEIHSMSMEFLAYPYMDNFFDKPNRYRKEHLASAIAFLPYGAMVDEFQEYVYLNVNASHLDRTNKWNELEKKYRPYINNKGSAYLTKGQRWMNQGHIFQSPFYYIDYTFAQLSAFQIFIENIKDHSKAWKKYLRLCKMGGKYPYLTLLKAAHLKDPFQEKSIKTIARKIYKIYQDMPD